MPTDREDIRLLVQFLRMLRGWDQRRMGAAAGLHPVSIGRYESGVVTPPRSTVEKLAAAAGLPLSVADRVLLPAIGVARRAVQPPPAEIDSYGKSEVPAGGGSDRRAAFLETLREAGKTAVGLFESGLAEIEVPTTAAPPCLADRLEVEDLWARIESLTANERRWLVEHEVEFHSWALAERMCDESERAAANDVAQAMQLTDLAVWIAENSAGSDLWLSRLQGFVRSFRVNSLRVDGKVRAAEGEIVVASRLWHSGADGDPSGILPQWRVLDLEASLRRDQRRFTLATELLARAYAAAPQEATGRILLKKASTLEQAGDIAGAAAALREAAPLLEQSGSLRDRFGVAFNLCVNLWHLGFFEEAKAGLPGLRELSVALGNGLDLIRVQWLGARVAAGLGCIDEARVAFEHVRDAFRERRNASDVAVVSLELAAIYLQEGRTAEVREMAEAMAWIFACEGIEREVVAALRLFCDAAKQETATSERVQALLASLKAARQSPKAGSFFWP
jgi:transcriptional regulator with XRE-family HTH domain